MSQEPAPLQGIDTILVRVSNLDVSLAFYTRALRLSVLFQDNTQRLAVLDTGSPVSLTLWETKTPLRPDPETASFPIFSTRDAARSRSLLREAGVQVGELVIEKAVSYFTFLDPDGNLLEACQVQPS